jgi:hypothetical protein
MHQRKIIHNAGSSSPAAVNNFFSELRRRDTCARPGKIKDHPRGVVCGQGKKPSGCGFALGRTGGLSFGFGGRFLALQVGIPPLPFLSFVVLLTHNSLHSKRIPIV